MINSTQMDIQKLMRTLDRVRPILNKKMDVLVKNAGRLVVESAIEHTPPGGKNVHGKAAQKRGESSIATDLFGGMRGGMTLGNNKQNRRMGIFFAVKESILKRFKGGKGRAMTDGQGTKIKIKARQNEDKEILFIRKDGTIYATQQNTYRPDASMGEMMAHHRRYFKNGRMTSSMSGRATTGQWVFVDSFVTSKENLEEFAQLLYKRVGIWAAGFMPAVKKLKARKIPKWIQRHEGIAKGRCLFIEKGDRFTIEMANSTGYGNIQRVFDVGLRSARGSMIKDAMKVKKDALEKAGLKK